MTDTKNILIAQRYSNALIDLAKEGKLEYEKISKNLNLIKGILNNSNDLNDFLTNPIISADDKKDVIIKVFSNEIDGLILNFLKVLVDKNRFNTFGQIVESYNASLDKIKNISRVQVISAVAITQDAKNRLVEKLSEKLNKTVEIENAIDESIIAGLVIKIGDNIIDTSLRHKLDELEKNITK